MPEWVIQTKLSPPERLADLPPRAPLQRRFESGLGQRLTLVLAAAGFGKTTGLAQWRAALRERGVPVAWLSLDHHDAHFFSFLSYLAAACDDAGFLRGRDFPRPSGEYAVLPDSQLASVLLTALSQVETPSVLILDDLHRAAGADTNAAEQMTFLAELLAAAPDGFTLALATREVPVALPLAELRLRDELNEIGPDALRFSAEEVSVYFDGLLGAKDPEEAGALLLERTEGWPVALRTVRRWLQEGASVQETLRQISGRSSDLADYFVEQVFDALSTEEQHFLLSTAPLERINGDLGSALCPGVRGWHLLESLERRETFVQCLDRQRYWYRYHRLFSEFLNERLRREAPERIPGIYRAAARWFLQAGHAQEALQHAVASADPAVCAELLEACGGWQYALKGHVASVQSVLDVLGEQDLASYPRVWLARIYLSARLGQLEQARQAMAALLSRQPSLPAAANSAGLGAEIEIMVELVRSYADEPITQSRIRTLEALRERCPAQNHVLRAVRANLLCALYRQTGRFEDCLRVGDEAIAHYRAIDSVYGEAFIYFHEGLACFNHGRLRDAETLYRQGLEIANHVFGARSDLSAIARAFLAQVSYARNRLPEAQSLLEGVLEHLEQFDAWLEVYQAAYGTTIRLDAARGNHDGCRQTAERALATARLRSLPRLGRSIVLLCRLLVPGAQDLQPGASGLRPDAPLAGPDSADAVTRQQAVLLDAREQIAQGQMLAALDALASSLAVATQEGRVIDAVELAIALAVGQVANGSADGGVATLERALSLSMFESLKRPFIDAGSALEPLLVRLAGKDGGPGAARSNRLRDVFLAELRAEQHLPAAEGDSEGNLLSNRERAVLLHVLQGRSNREIAEALEVSINTIKFHLKNIYEKLGVSSRREAASLAMEQQLI